MLRSRTILIQINAVAVFLAIFAAPCCAYPEFQSFVEKNSGRTADCAMCHVHPNGPTGQEEGQVGSLNEEEMKRLNLARAALEPGQNVDSPILNRFGNSIIKQMGKMKFLDAKKDPALLAQSLNSESDLDGDGIPDRQEFLDGTDPLNKFHGDPWRLFLANLNRDSSHILACVVGVFLLDWGFINMIRGFHAVRKARAAQRQSAAMLAAAGNDPNLLP